MENRHFIIGFGEVGKALQKALDCDWFDIKNPECELELTTFLHICFPYFDGFEDEVKKYIKICDPKYVVVHSTVPIGTCKRLGVTHSPIRGKHPDLYQSILQFKKYVGGINAVAVAKELEKFKIKTKVVTHSNDTEAGKLYDLMQYAVSILLNKHIYKQCKEKGLNFDCVYRSFNKTYNEGYYEMEMAEFLRPVLEFHPGPIGGHCVIPMMSLLDDPLAKDIISANKNIKENE